MATVEVWAPRASLVEVDVDGRRCRLTSSTDRAGWWAASVPGMTHGTRYALVLDGGDPLPDPLARRMPAGTHAASQWWDPSRYAWGDQAWSGRDFHDPRTLLYELHIGTFTTQGTLDAAIERLDHLVDLGVTHVELMPLAAFDGARGWGYDGVALNAVHEPYGGPDALCRFVDAAHARGLAVLLDVVHNHLGPSGNYWGRFGPFFTERHVTPWGAAINLDDAGSDDVRSILTASALRWLEEFHLDGLRLDAVHALRDERAVPFLEVLAAQVEVAEHRLRRPLVLVAESDRNDPQTVAPRGAHGLGLTAQWDDDIHHALHWLLTGEVGGYYADFGSCDAVGHALERGFLHDGRYSSFRGRRHGRPIDFAATPHRRFVAALQTHDQVGNRARGERLSQLVSADRLAAGAALLLTLPYTPMLFMGEEWGASTPWHFFTSFDDDELARAVTEGRRLEFAPYGWNSADVPDPQAQATFEVSRLNWAEPDEPEHAELLEWYRALVALRATGHLSAPVSCRWEAGGDGRPRWFEIRCGGQASLVSFVDEPIIVRPALEGASLTLAWRGGAAWDQDGQLALAAGCSAVMNS
ncbi:MAG: malto-oligosyltrehalose trehalohydrolase [Candidatus Nanopelagicales bacterium]